MYTAQAFARRKAVRDFERLHQQGLHRRFWSGMTGRRHTLLNLHDVEKHTHIDTRSHAGVRLVPIAQICGSEGRCGDFDADSRPFKRHTQGRWVGIALARQQDVALPLVELVQIGDIYFVRDGHHRISVARMLGQGEIEAEVTVWHCREGSEALCTQESMPQRANRLRQPIDLVQRLLSSIGKITYATRRRRSLPVRKELEILPMRAAT